MPWPRPGGELEVVGGAGLPASAARPLHPTATDGTDGPGALSGTRAVRGLHALQIPGDSSWAGGQAPEPFPPELLHCLQGARGASVTAVGGNTMPFLN